MQSLLYHCQVEHHFSRKNRMRDENEYKNRGIILFILKTTFPRYAHRVAPAEKMRGGKVKVRKVHSKLDKNTKYQNICKTFQWYIAFVIALAQILCGCTLAYSTFLIRSLKKEGFDNALIEPWIGSMVNLAGSILVFFVTPMIGTFGRKFNLQILFAINIVGWSGLILSPNFLCICICLCILSFSMVMTIPLAVTYISETCDKKRRGVLLSLDFVFISIGNSVDYILDAYLARKVTALIFAAVAIVGLFLSRLMPETKYWHVLRGEWKHAEKSYLWFQPQAAAKDAALELAAIRTTVDETRKITFFTFVRDVRQMKYFKGLLLGLVLYVLRVCAGRPIFVSFTVNVFKDLHTPYDCEKLALCYGIFDIVGCVVVQYLVYRCDRKSLLLCFSAIMISCLTSASLYLWLQNLFANPFPWFPVACVYVYAVIVSTGYISTVGIMVSEIVYAEYRAPIMCVVTFGLFFTTFLLTGFYAQYESVIPIQFVFVFFVIGIILCVLVVFAFVPETVNKEFYRTGF